MNKLYIMVLCALIISMGVQAKDYDNAQGLRSYKDELVKRTLYNTMRDELPPVTTEYEQVYYVDQTSGMITGERAYSFTTKRSNRRFSPAPSITTYYGRGYTPIEKKSRVVNMLDKAPAKTSYKVSFVNGMYSIAKAK